MSTKKLSIGLVVVLLTAGLALPAQAQKDDDFVWGWLNVLWQGWFGIETPVSTGGEVDHEILPVGVAADPFGRVRLVATPPPSADSTDAGVTADPFG